jgi:hypothetical protein
MALRKEVAPAMTQKKRNRVRERWARSTASHRPICSTPGQFDCWPITTARTEFNQIGEGMTTSCVAANGFIIPLRDARPSPANEAIVASRQGLKALRQIAPRRAVEHDADKGGKLEPHKPSGRLWPMHYSENNRQQFPAKESPLGSAIRSRSQATPSCYSQKRVK